MRNIGSFARFLQALSFSHANVLNLANISREAQVSRKTIDGYMEILEDLLIGLKLDVFTRRAKRELAAHPKFYFFDTGVFRANRPEGPLDSSSEIGGGALEGLVAQHLRAWIDYTKEQHVLHYWQTRARVEVDFVVYGETGIHCVEVKHAKRVDPADIRSLKIFKEDYPEATCYFLYCGDDRLIIDDVLCVPPTNVFSH